MSHHHDHLPHGAGTHRGRLAVVLGITATVLVTELVGAWVSGSVALLADAGHMLTDLAGLVMALVAAQLARRPATPERTWGWLRAEVLGAGAQALLLLVVGVVVLVEAVQHLVSPEPVAPGAMLVFGAVGLVGNVIGLLVLAGAREANLNLRAAFLEVFNDALGSVAVLAAALAVRWTGWERADAVASLVIVALIVPRTLVLLRQVLRVLLEATPGGLDLDEVRAHIEDLPHVREVHDLHASQVATGVPVLTAHVVADESCFHDGHMTGLLDRVQECLREDFGITHSTVQFEPPAHAGHEVDVHA
ncbi:MULTISPECIES: cation diffusion facilitator family transporter [Kytococcus]|uniref:Cation transporter n=1 Tax=Kytococcus schroeteri TaxID=138300 RepID=A0A2I1PAV9_9MICO|nr:MULTISPECIES: cation diffusion facilitator family transporter [Kytococcus]OFS08473.1 cation transporter [Kytococcus sp. HMSC28H12]PKZ41772.1 cation transporter [Kytococcus schroeteri]